MPKKLLATASLVGTLLLTGGKAGALKPLPALISSQGLKEMLAQILFRFLPKNQRVLTAGEEEKIEQEISRTLGLRASFSLEGRRLNHQWGLMGLEQHLARFPGDSLAGRNFVQAGMAPGRGAFGWFADAAQEKYYVAVQTLYLPDWNQKAAELKPWYKFRKVLVVNPAAGTAVVAVIGDAGPAESTGRQFGGSPQVMHDLGFYPKTHEGRVLLLFVDDPENKIPLGQITVPFNAPQPQLT